LKEKITAFIHNLISYDYMLFGGVFVLFLLFVVLSILLRKKIGLSLFFLLLGFIILFVGPTVGYKELHKYLFKSEVAIISQKQLSFTPAIVLKGSVKNMSKFDFKECKIRAYVHKVSKNKLKNYIYQFKNIKKMSMLVQDIPKGQSRNFKMIIEPFNYQKNYNISIQARCR
jgi:hypothetical protein